MKFLSGGISFTPPFIFQVELSQYQYNFSELFNNLSKFKILIFLTNLSRKGLFRSKHEKKKNRHQILHIRISLGTKFQLQQTILVFLNHIYPKKKILSMKIRNNKHRHWILHIQISRSTNIWLKLPILKFGRNLPEKGICYQKQKKWTLIEFC